MFFVHKSEQVSLSTFLFSNFDFAYPGNWLLEVIENSLKFRKNTSIQKVAFNDEAIRSIVPWEKRTGGILSKLPAMIVFSHILAQYFVFVCETLAGQEEGEFGLAEHKARHTELLHCCKKFILIRRSENSNLWIAKIFMWIFTKTNWTELYGKTRMLHIIINTLHVFWHVFHTNDVLSYGGRRPWENTFCKCGPPPIYYSNTFLFRNKLPY